MLGLASIANPHAGARARRRRRSPAGSVESGLPGDPANFLFSHPRLPPRSRVEKRTNIPGLPDLQDQAAPGKYPQARGRPKRGLPRQRRRRLLLRRGRDDEPYSAPVRSNATSGGILGCGRSSASCYKTRSGSWRPSAICAAARPARWLCIGRPSGWFASGYVADGARPRRQLLGLPEDPLRREAVHRPLDAPLSEQQGRRAHDRGVAGHWSAATASTGACTFAARSGHIAARPCRTSCHHKFFPLAPGHEARAPLLTVLSPFADSACSRSRSMPVRTAGTYCRCRPSTAWCCTEAEAARCSHRDFLAYTPYQEESGERAPRHRGGQRLGGISKLTPTYYIDEPSSSGCPHGEDHPAVQGWRRSRSSTWNRSRPKDWG